MKRTNDPLSVGECALLYCVLGEPAKNGGRYYPGIDEALSYIKYGKKGVAEPEWIQAQMDMSVEVSGRAVAG